MSGFSGQVAIVTGGGSGIGAALVKALRTQGAIVVSADLEPGPDGVKLDVTDATAVGELVDRVVAEHGRLDLMFNNAGISLIGETQDLTLAQWNQIIDVNIRGVVHGVAAAYPVMIRQGSGHIVNTASMGGLMAAGLLTSYVMTKHAVVGLSLALRSEAAAYGVGVTAICPAAVNTPILDKGEFGQVRGRDYFLKGQGIRKPIDPDALAARTLAAVAAGQALVVEPLQSRLAWRLQRIAPGFTQKASIRFVAKQRQMATAQRSEERMNPDMTEHPKKRPDGLDSPIVPKLMKFSGKAHVRVYRLTRGRIGSNWRIGAGFRKPVPTLLLDHVGRKSGKQFTTPLLYLNDDPNVVIVASQGGLPKNPQWYANLVAGPDTRVQLKGELREVRARTATADERAALWPRLVELYADFANYQAWTEREIPVVVLEPR